MTPEERDLRRALDARSGEPSPQFRARLTSAFDEGQPASGLVQAISVVVVVAITLGTVGVLLMSRNTRNQQDVASGTRIVSPTPSPTTIPMPSTAQIIAPTGKVVWVLVANSALFRSTDQGNTWEPRGLPAPTVGRNAISFINDHEGWVLAPGSPKTQCSVASAVVWHTTDAGASWQQVSSAISTQGNSSGMSYAQCNEFIYFYDSTHGFITAQDDNHRPTIYRTLDGGKTWSGSTLPDPPDFKTSPGGFTLQATVFKRFSNTLYVVASGMQNGDIPGRQYMFRSTDGGATWSWLMKIPSPYVAMVTESRWLQLNWPGQSMESTNGGQQWHPFASDFNSDTPVGGPQIVFADSQVGYAEGRGALQRTVDGGLHWARIATPGTANSTQDWPNVPVGRVGAGLTYDAKHGYLLMFGGTTFADSNSASPPPGFKRADRGIYQFVSDETWIWDGDHWALLHPPSSPSARAFPAMAYDPHLQQVILVGASGSDMWAWDGTTWTERRPAHLPQNFCCAVLDRDLGVVMLGYEIPSNPPHFDIWQWTGSDWTKKPTTGSSLPRFEFGVGVAYDPDHHQEMFVGGYFLKGNRSLSDAENLGETWLLRQGKWSQWSPGSVGPSGDVHAAYDEERHQLVAVALAGTAPDWAGETWTWDGATWTKRNPQHRPPGALSSQSLAYDAGSKRIVMFGGKSDLLNSIPLNQTWAWDGSDWIRLT